MTTIDFNLLPALNALLEESSVTRAAARIGVTTPSMSRTLSRLREALHDPLLVRAGRLLVPTPFAVSMRDRVAALTGEGHALLRGASGRPLANVERFLTIRANDGIMGPWVDDLVKRVRSRAPLVSLSFVSEGDESPADLREGRVDLDIGVLDDATPELRSQSLVDDRFIGVVRRGHPWTRGRKTAARFASFEHLGISRRGRFVGPIDKALKDLGLTRKVVATVPSALAALVAAARSDLVTAVPSVVAHSLADVLPIACFEIPLELPRIRIAQTWHPRFDADPAHRWLRECMVQIARGMRSSVTKERVAE